MQRLYSDDMCTAATLEPHDNVKAAMLLNVTAVATAV
jgi:hypothetical protein